MARPLRIQYPGAVYHVMNRGGSRQRVFLENQDYESFLKTMREIHERWGVEFFGWKMGSSLWLTVVAVFCYELNLCPGHCESSLPEPSTM